MEAYFVPKDDKFRGCPIPTLPTVINNDFCPIPAGELTLITKDDLDHQFEINDRRQNTMDETISDHMRSMTEDRTQWRRLSANI